MQVTESKIRAPFILNKGIRFIGSNSLNDLLFTGFRTPLPQNLEMEHAGGRGFFPIRMNFIRIGIRDPLVGML
jgi:hypothetical protein